MKKFIVVKLSLVMLMITVLAACGGNNSTEKSGDKPVLKMLSFARSFEPNQDPVAKLLEQETGYKAEYFTLPIENQDDHLNLLMANQEDYDVLKLNANQFNMLAEQGALAPLDDLLDEHGKTLKELNSDYLELAQLNGVTYGIPERSARSYVGSSLAIRKSVLDAVGMDVPATLDDFYKLLVAIKEKTGMIPLTGYQGIIPEISGAFGFVTALVETEGKLVSQVEYEGMPKYLEFMNKLYDEGLADPEWPVNQDATVKEKFTRGQAAIMPYGWGMASAVTKGVKEVFPDDEIIVIPGLAGPDGKQTSVIQSGGVGWYIAIPAWSKHKEDAMKWLDLKVQPALFDNMVNGVQGVHFDLDAEGKRYPILPIFNDERGNADWFMTSSRIQDYEDQWLVRVRKDEVMYKVFLELQPQLDFGVRDPLFNAPPMPVMASHQLKLDQLAKDYIIKVIAGAEDLSTYSDFLKEWNSMGGADTIKEVNEWYKTKK